MSSSLIIGRDARQQLLSVFSHGQSVLVSATPTICGVPVLDHNVRIAVLSTAHNADA